MGDQNYKIKVEYGIAIVIVLIGMFFIYQATTIQVSKEAVGPRTMPMFLAVSLVIGGLWIAVRTFLGKTPPIKEGYGFLESNVSRIALVVACGILFIFVFWATGYFLALFVTFIAMMLTFGVRDWIKMLIGSLILSIIFHWLFMGIMRLNNPTGALVNLKPYTSWIIGE